MLVYGVRMCGVQEVLEEHAACAGTLAKVKNDLARARNEAGIADHGVCHKMVQVTSCQKHFSSSLSVSLDQTQTTLI